MEKNLNLLFLLIFFLFFLIYKLKKHYKILNNDKFLYSKNELIINDERIKFFSNIKNGTHLWITKNTRLSIEDLEKIKIILIESLNSNKKQFDDKTEIPFSINGFFFVLRLPLSFENYLKIKSGKYTTYEESTYEDFSNYDSITSNSIQSIEFKEEKNNLNLYDFMATLKYSSLFEINKNSFKLYEMIKI